MSDRTAEIRERLEDDTASTVSFSLNTVTCTDYIVISPKTRDEILALLTRVEEAEKVIDQVSLSEQEGKSANAVYREQNAMADPYAVEKAVECVLFSRRRRFLGGE